MFRLVYIAVFVYSNSIKALRAFIIVTCGTMEGSKMGRFPDVKVKKRDPAPTYIKTFDALLVDHMAKGLSFHSFAGVIGVPVTTIHSWCDSQPSFAESREIGESKMRLFYEQLGIEGTTGNIKGFNGHVYIFMTKNKLKWSDRVVLESKDAQPIVLSYDPVKLLDGEEK